MPLGTDPENLPSLGQGHEGIHKTLHYSLTRLLANVLGLVSKDGHNFIKFSYLVKSW